MNPWHNAAAHWPPMDKAHDRLSVEVTAKTKSGKICRAFCTNDGDWYNVDAGVKREKIVGWKLEKEENDA